jgi:protein TonB
MSAMTLQASPPWSVGRGEDRLFRWILSQTLAVSLIIGAITPYIRLPQPEAGLARELPPRRVYLLAEQPKPASRPAPLALPPAVTEQPKPQTIPKRPPVAPVATPRQKAASSGVLAMRDALTELRASAPLKVAGPGEENSVAEVYQDTDQPSTLTANVTRGSGGIAGGVDHESVLGTASLPARQESQLDSSLAGSATATGQISSGPPGLVRSQEEIQELLDRNKGAMYTLYDRELRKDASLQGKLVVSITIAPQGNVTRCVILSSELNSVSLQRQLVALVTRIDFGNRPGATVVTTRIPIEFFPR